jgi:PAS domain S-box-containing protein
MKYLMSTFIETAKAASLPQGLDPAIIGRRVQTALTQTECQSPEVLGELLGALPAAIYTIDAQGRITFYNDAAADLWGCRPELGKSEWCGSWRLYWPDGKPMPHGSCPMAVALRERRLIKGAEAVAERPDGTRVAFLAYPTPLYSAKGALVGAVNMLVDVTERKRAEALESAQGRALQMLAEGVPLKAILESLIAAIEQRSANGMLGSIVLLNESGTHFQRGMGLSLPDAFNAAIEGITVGSFNGICCHAVATRGSVVVSDFNADPRWARFAEFAAPYGLRAGWSTPIFGSDGKVLGTFANYYRKPCNPTPQELEWVEIVRRTATIAIERRRAEQSGQRLIAIVESSEDAIVSKDINGIITTWNPTAERLFGYTAAEVIGRPVTILIPADRRDEEHVILERIRRGEHIEHYETVRRRKDGTLIDISLTVSPIRNAEGEIVGASKIARDITERRRAQEQQTLLLREMSHRVKNLFAVASGLVTVSARSARTPTEMAKALRERLDALALAHGLTRSGLIVAEDKGGHGATLHSLVQTIFSPYVDGRECVAVSCPDVPVGPNAVTGVAMVLHEFATNAVKYGALSRPEGFVSIDGAVENDVLLLIWEERDGPRLKGPPDHEGFGGTLADRIIKGQFGGELAYAWNPEGLIIRLSMPMTGLTK